MEKELLTILYRVCQRMHESRLPNRRTVVESGRKIESWHHQTTGTPTVIQIKYLIIRTQNSLRKRNP